VVIETKDKTKIPTIIVEGKDIKQYNLPVGSHIGVEEGDEVKAGQVLVKIPRILGKLRDITGGLPRVTELFEASNPGNPAIVCEIDGVVSFGNVKRGNREIIVEVKRWNGEEILGSIDSPDSGSRWRLCKSGYTIV
jgi:DNA-directed RNA polymerase subunit beta'